jgi:dCMP deaminase
MGVRNWDEYFLQRARLNASMSTCIRRSVGAVAVRDRRSFADAYNGTAPGTRHCVDGGCPRCADTKLGPGLEMMRCLCVHAEQNIVAFCAREGIKLDGSTLYQTTKPCTDCMKLLVSAGIVEVVYDEEYPQDVDIVYPQMPVRRFSV